jgi:aminoglycoside phosphotransferase (APT) family kinase protein
MLAYIDEEKQRQLQAAAPRLRQMCAELDQYRAPATLMHGDMHMGNVAHRGNGYLFFDWTDACIAHPFLDMIDIVHERDVAVQTRLRDSYLKEWLAYEPMDRLLEMWKLAYPLCALHQAVSYRYILANTEERCKYELNWAMPFWFGKILESLDTSISESGFTGL